MKSNLIDTTHLPNNVVAALQQGSKLEAVKLLCDATGLGMLDAKAAIELHLQKNPAPWDLPQSAAHWPADVAQALHRGDKMQAIELLRSLRGMGLQEAKDAIEGAHLDPDAAATASATLSPAADKAWLTGFNIIFAWGAVALLACVVSFVYRMVQDLK
jgi:ribosomal protein L7/L12